MATQSPAVPQSTNDNPGYKTTEFWLSALNFLAGLGLVIYGGIKGNSTLAQVGTAMAAGSSVGYSLSRGLKKAGTAQNVLNSLFNLLTVLRQNPDAPSSPAPTTDQQAADQLRQIAKSP